MEISCQKIENCFPNSRTYEYKLPMTVEEFSEILQEEGGSGLKQGWSKRTNRKLRRPVFLAERGSLKAKGILAGNFLRVGFPEDDWEREKAAWEEFLKGL